MSTSLDLVLPAHVTQRECYQRLQQRLETGPPAEQRQVLQSLAALLDFDGDIQLWPVRKGSPLTEYVPSTAVFCRRSALVGGCQLQDWRHSPLPGRKGMLYEIGVVVTGISGHFLAKPARSVAGLVLALKLNLRNDHSCLSPENSSISQSSPPYLTL